MAFTETKAKSGEPMYVCSDCGNGNIRSLGPEAWCYHYKKAQVSK